MVRRLGLRIPRCGGSCGDFSSVVLRDAHGLARVQVHGSTWRTTWLSSGPGGVSYARPRRFLRRLWLCVMRSFVCRLERTGKEYELRVAVFNCGEELDANTPEGLMDAGVNDITYWCPGVEENVAMLHLPSLSLTRRT